MVLSTSRREDTHRRSTMVDFFHSSDVASIMQRRSPPQEGKRLAPAGCARGGSYNGKAASPLHTGNTRPWKRAGRRGRREGEERRAGRRWEKKKEEEKGETGPSAKGVHREPYRSSPEHYSVYRSSLVKSCQKMSLRGGQGVGERWKSWWKKYGGRERIGKQKRRARGNWGGWMEACRLIVVSGNGARSVYAILWRPLKAVVEVRLGLDIDAGCE